MSAPELTKAEVAAWAERNGIYPESAARLAFEDAATSDWAKQFHSATLLSQVARLREGLKSLEEGLGELSSAHGGSAFVYRRIIAGRDLARALLAETEAKP